MLTGRCSGGLVRRLALVGLLLAGLAPAAWADLVVTKSHVVVDNPANPTPGMLCEGDQVCFTIHVECTVKATTINRLTDGVPYSYYSAWSIGQTFGTNCSTNVGPLSPTGPSGLFCASNLSMAVGDKLDFLYCATVRNDTSTPRTCGTAVAREPNNTPWNSNSDCVNYDCVVPVPDVFTIKTYTVPPSPVVGDTLAWRVDVTNRGTKPDTNVRVTDVADPLVLTGVQYKTFSRCPNVCTSPGPCTALPDCLPPGPNLDVTWATLAAGETVSFTVQGTYVDCAIKPGPPPPPNDPVCNIVTITSDTIKTTEADQIRQSHPNGSAPEGPSCVLATSGDPGVVDPAVKSVRDLDGAPTYAGDVVEYTVVFQNQKTCPSDAGNLMDALPAGVALVPGSVVLSPATAGTDMSAGNDVVIANLVVPGRTPSGAGQVTVTFRATVTATIGQVCNQGDYTFGTGSPGQTNQACFDVADGTPVGATKTHDDPNGNGTLRRGQKLQYTVRITNRGTATASDVKLTDTIPAGLAFYSLDQNAGGTTVSTTPLLRIDSITVDPGTANAKEVRFTVVENGTQPSDTVVCNQATITTAADRTGPFTTSPTSACVKIVDTPPCTRPAPPWPFKGAKKRGTPPQIDAAWQWLTESNSEGGYRVYSVEAKSDLKVPPGANASNVNATKQCETTAVASTSCTHPNVFSPAQKRILFYQVVGVCADQTEGAN